MLFAVGDPNYLPEHLALDSRHLADLGGLTVIGPDGNIRAEYFKLYQSRFPEEMKGWCVHELGNLFWDIELQQMHEGLFTVRYTLTALYNFHKKMLLWNDPEAVQIREDGQEQELLLHLANVVLHKGLVTAMLVAGDPKIWPTANMEERQHFMPAHPILAFNVAWLDRLDDILRINNLEGTDEIALFLFETPRPVDHGADLGVLRIDPPKCLPQQPFTPDPDYLMQYLNKDKLAEKSVVRPTTRLKKLSEIADS